MILKSKSAFGRFFPLLLTVMVSSAAQAWNYLTPLTNQVVCPGDTARFSTTASGPTPYKFKWYKDAAILSGQTNNSLTISNVGAANVGTYTVILQGGYNNVTNSATLSLRTPVSITPLADLVRAIGANALFSTVASGTGPFTYAWQKNGSPLPGRTNSSLILSNLGTNDSGTYTVIVNGKCSSATSSGTLTVEECFPSLDVMLVIDRSGSMTGAPYSNARQACSNFVQNLNYSSDQAGLVSYNSVETLDQTLTNSLLALDQAIGSIPAAGGYTSITLGIKAAQAELGSVRHNPQALPVLVLLSDGNPTGSDTASNALYSATAAKNVGIRVFTVGLGAVDHTLMAGIASSTNDYFYTTNSSELTELFNAISILICRPPTNLVVTGPSDLALCPGSTASFSVTASGCEPFGYQWTWNGAKLAGQTNNSLIITNVSANDAGVYGAEVSGVCRSVTNSATLTVKAPTSVETPPGSQTHCPGSPVIFAVTAAGTAPLDYQWRKDGTNILGATNDIYSIAAVSDADAGWYDVIVNNSCGAAASSAAALFVNAPLSATGPSDQAACPGDPAGFGVNASGTGPFGYAWLKSGSPIDGQTNSTLSFNQVTPADAGVYSVIVSGACGSVTNSGTLTVYASVSATPLVSQTNCPGTTAAFSTVAGGTGPHSYEWLKNGGAIAGQTGSTLTLNDVNAGDAGIYSVVVSGLCGRVTNSAALAVNTPVSATALVSQTNCPGSTAVFSTAASGTGPFGYEWFKNGNLIPEQTGSLLTLNNITGNDAGLYRVIVSGACGSVTNSAILVVFAPVGATALLSQTNCPGSTAIFQTVASGTSPYSYQWFKDGSVLGETGSSLVISNITSASAGIYSVIVSGACGSVTNSAALSVNTPVSATALISQTNCPDTTAVFGTVASGTGPYIYQWSRNGTLIGGATGSSLVVSNVTAANAGTYRVIVSGTCGSVTNSAILAVNTPVSATSLANQTNCPGTTAVFSTVAGGTGPFTYQWLKNGSSLSATGSSLVISNVTSANAGTYRVIVSGACGSVTNSAILAVNALATATALISQTNCPGTTAVFGTVAGGAGPFTYQWLKNGSVLGAAGSSLVISNVTSANAGTYSVIVSGACGSVTNSAILAVNALATATALVSQTNCPGTTAVFSTVAGGTGPFTYQWLKNGSSLSAAGSSLVISNVTSANAGTYSVIVSGACGSVTHSAILAVNTLVSATALVSQTNCPGTTAVFSTVAGGAGPFTYQWSKNGSVLGAAGSSLVISNVTSANAGTYSVIVSGACGSVTNSAALSINAATIASPLADQILNLGGTAVFMTTASGTGPFSYVWKKNGGVISGQTGSSLVLSNATYAEEGTYTVEVTGACGADTQSASLHINLPPTVNIFSPTNGTVFMAPASFPLLANAADSDGEIIKVEFYSSTNKIGEVTNAAYYSTNLAAYILSLTNLPPGTNIFTAVATDDFGSTGTSAPVRVVMVTSVPLTPGAVLYDPQHDPYFVQQVTITNPTPAAFDRVRIFISNLTNVPAITVYNASGTTNGLPFVDAQGPIPPGGTLSVSIIYYSPRRITPRPVLQAVVLSGAGSTSVLPLGTPQHINRSLKLVNGTFMVEFMSVSGRTYAVLYSSDLVHWKASEPYINGSGSWIQWVDIGAPLTESAPTAATSRFYRVIEINQ